MILILIALVSGMVLGIWLFKESDNNYSAYGTFLCVFSGIFTIVCGIGILLYAFLSVQYISADYKKDIINREFGTNYTQDEVFYASDVIDTIREIKRTRVEISGDLLRNDKN